MPAVIIPQVPIPIRTLKTGVYRIPLTIDLARYGVHDIRPDCLLQIYWPSAGGFYGVECKAITADVQPDNSAGDEQNPRASTKAGVVTETVALRRLADDTL